MSTQNNLEWRYDNKEEAELFFLALAARHHAGQQQDPIIYNTGVDDDESDVDSFKSNGDGGSGDDDSSSTLSLRRTDSADTGMKEKFLDNFAELISRKKESGYPSCAALKEGANEAFVFVTRNKGFSDTNDEVQFFNDLSEQLMDIRKEYTKRKTTKLFDKLLEYYSPRLRFHVRTLLERPVNATLDNISSDVRHMVLVREYKSFIKACRSAVEKGFGLDRIRFLPTWAYNLSRSLDIQSTLLSICEQDEADQTVRELRFVARIRGIHSTLVASVRTFPSFAKLTIRPIPSPGPQKPPRLQISKARAAAQKALIRLSISPPKGFDQPRLLEELKAEYNQKLVPHCEMQMVFFLLNSQNSKWALFPYLGISKKTCYMCSAFLSQLKAFKTRPSHGKVYPRWTLPQALQTNQRTTFALRLALECVKQNLAEILRKSPGPRLALQPESTTVWSSKPSIRSGTASVGSAQLAAQLQRVQVSSLQAALKNARTPVDVPALAITDLGEQTESWESAESEESVILRSRFEALVQLLKASLTFVVCKRSWLAYLLTF